MKRRYFLSALSSVSLFPFLKRRRGDAESQWWTSYSRGRTFNKCTWHFTYYYLPGDQWIWELPVERLHRSSYAVTLNRTQLRELWCRNEYIREFPLESYLDVDRFHFRSMTQMGRVYRIADFLELYLSLKWPPEHWEMVGKPRITTTANALFARHFARLARHRLTFPNTEHRKRLAAVKADEYLAALEAVRAV